MEPETLNDRLDTLKELITQSFLLQLRQPPEGAQLEAMALAWNNLLSDVKAKHMPEIYDYAMKARPADRQAYAVTANEMRFVVDQRRRGLIFARGEWLDEMLYDENGMYFPRKLVM